MCRSRRGHPATAAEMSPLILKRLCKSPSGQRRDDDYDVLENGVVVGSIFRLDAVLPQGQAWMWRSGHNGHNQRDTRLPNLLTLEHD